MALMYRLWRAIGIDGMVSKRIQAIRGTTAGSGFTTSELRVLLQDLMETLQKEWPTDIYVKLFADDFTLAATGLPAIIIRTVVEASS